MSNRPVLGSGPVQFIGSDSNLYFVPLTSLSVAPDGSVDATKWIQAITSLKDTDRSLLADLLKEQMNRGTIVAGKAPASREAISFQAATKGELGNFITVNITNMQKDATDPGNALKATISLEVTEQLVFSKLSIDKNSEDKNFVGTILSDANSPGLVKIKSSVADSVLYPKSGEYIVKAGVIEITQAASADPSFTLEPKNAASGTDLKAIVDATDPNQKVFSIAFTRTAKVSAKLSGLISGPPANATADPSTPSVTALVHAVFILAPSGKTAAVAIPAVGLYTLAGGSDEITTPAIRSSVTAFTNE